MKTIKFLLVSLMVMLGTVAFAQDVVIHKTDGTTEVIENADSVVYDVQDYGYYGYSTESYKAAAALAANQYTKLTSSPQVINWLKSAYVVIATPSNTKPTYQYYSKAGQTYTDPMALFTGSRVGVSDTITINSKTYYVWVSNKLSDDEDTTNIKITTK